VFSPSPRPGGGATKESTKVNRGRPWHPWTHLATVEFPGRNSAASGPTGAPMAALPVPLTRISVGRVGTAHTGEH